MAAIGAATVAVPPLIAPRGGSAELPQPATALGTESGPTPDVTFIPSGPAIQPADATPAVARPAPCSPTAAILAAGVPACAVYRTTLGNGWQIDGAGVKVVAGATVPGSERAAMRVEPEQDVASVSLVASRPFTVPSGGHLSLRVYGGRVHGTVLRVSTSPTKTADRSDPVVVTAPADQWSTFVVQLAGGRPVQRIDLVIATDLVPHAYRFFVDDVEFVK